MSDEEEIEGDAAGVEDQALADWEFRVQQERELFQLYERRRVDYEAQATAVTAAALTIAHCSSPGRTAWRGWEMSSRSERRSRSLGSSWLSCCPRSRASPRGRRLRG